jgi:hypothetical protein
MEPQGVSYSSHGSKPRGRHGRPEPDVMRRNAPGWRRRCQQLVIGVRLGLSTNEHAEAPIVVTSAVPPLTSYHANRRMSIRSGDAVNSGMTGRSCWVVAAQISSAVQVQGRWYCQ